MGGGHGGVWTRLGSRLPGIGGMVMGESEAPGDLAVGYRWGGVMGESGSTWGFGCRLEEEEEEKEEEEEEEEKEKEVEEEEEEEDRRRGEEGSGRRRRNQTTQP